MFDLFYEYFDDSLMNDTLDKYYLCKEDVLYVASQDLVSHSSAFSSRTFYDKLCAWFPFSIVFCSINVPPIHYENPLMTFKGCPKLIVKGRPINPLDFFIDQDPIFHAYHTHNSPQLIFPIFLPPSQLVLLQAPLLPTTSFK